jgi:hypothetical protein
MTADEQLDRMMVNMAAESNRQRAKTNDVKPQQEQPVQQQESKDLSRSRSKAPRNPPLGAVSAWA